MRSLSREAVAVYGGYMGKRVYVYIDGFNLYNGAVKDKPQYKWLDLMAFSKRLMGGDNVLKVKYFTAKVLGFRKQKRQQIYWDALRHLYNKDKFEIVEGFFRIDSKKRPITLYQFNKLNNCTTNNYIWILNSTEKCTDVNLAIHIINDAWKNLYDKALIISNDSDLIGAIKLVKGENPP